MTTKQLNRYARLAYLENLASASILTAGQNVELANLRVKIEKVDNHVADVNRHAMAKVAPTVAEGEID